jgi:arsenical pump membrane protein
MVLDAADQVWAPFALVAGLLLIGEATAADGAFRAVSGRIAQAPLSPRGLLGGLLALVAVVAAVWNLDTAVVFLTPVLIHAARMRHLDERPFLYGAGFMSNSGSLLLPASNLTNLLVLRGDPTTSAQFAAQMLPAWVAACALTIVFLLIVYPLAESSRHAVADTAPMTVGPGVVAAVSAGALMITMASPALPVLALGIGAILAQRSPPHLNLRLGASLVTLTTALDILGHTWHAPTNLIATQASWPTALIAALAAVLVNNLPASVLLSAHPVAHPAALLIGLDLGPTSQSPDPSPRCSGCRPPEQPAPNPRSSPTADSERSSYHSPSSAPSPRS